MNVSQDSLLAALKTLEIVGSLSGLKMNIEKTKIVWLGRIKYSRDKLECKFALEWGCTQFILLGLEYNVNLSEMVTINYAKVLNKSKNILINWRKIYLSPVAKITLIKTFILSLFKHV